MPQICISMVSSSDCSLKPPKTKILEVTDYSSRLLACHICHHDRQNDLGLKSISELSRPAIPSLDSRRKNLWGNINNITIILHEYIIYPPFIKTFQWVQQKKPPFSWVATSKATGLWGFFATALGAHARVAFPHVDGVNLRTERQNLQGQVDSGGLLQLHRKGKHETWNTRKRQKSNLKI